MNHTTLPTSAPNGSEPPNSEPIVLESHPDMRSQASALSHRKSTEKIPHNEEVSYGASQPESWHAWSTVLGIFIIQFSVVGVITAFGVFQSFYVTEWLPHYSPSAISWIGSVQNFFELACAPIGGKLYDAGFGRSSVLFGSFLSMFSFFMMSLVKPNQYYQLFLSQGVGMGVGLMLVFGPSMTMLSEHFSKRRGLAMGLCSASSPIGGIFFTILLNHLFHNGTGFTQGMRIVSYMSLGCFVIGNLLIRSPPKKHRQVHEAEPEAPLLDATYLTMLLGALMWSSGSQTPNFYLQLFASQKNHNTSLVFNSFAILCVGSIFGRIVPGWLADWWGPPKVFIPSLFLLGGVSAAMLGCGSSAGLVVFALLYGYLFGTLIAIYMPMVASYGPKGQSMGRRMGWALCPIGVGLTVGPPIVGAILGSHYVWWRAITFSTLIITASGGVNVIAWTSHLRHSASREISDKSVI